MPRHPLRDIALKIARVTAHNDKQGKKEPARFFPVVEGFDQVDKDDIEGQKDIAKTAISGWAHVEKAEINVKNVSGAGRSATYMMTAPEGTNPRRIIMHNKNISTDEAEMANERRQERIVHAISVTGATCGRLAEGQTWYIEPCAGQDFHPNQDGSDTEKVAILSAKFHRSGTEWWHEYKKEVMPRYPGIEKFPNGDPVFYSVVNRDVDMFITNDMSLGFLAAMGYQPVSEAGKRVVTSHGDFHPGNMLTQEDGTLIAIDLECCYNTYACVDALYYLVQTHSSRDSYRKYAEVYLKESGLDCSEASVNAFLFDIEMIKLTCPLIGLNMSEGFLMMSSMTPDAEGNTNPYDMSVGAGVRRILAAVATDKKFQEDIVSKGLYTAVFERADPEYTATLSKWGKNFPYLSPEFYEFKDVCALTFKSGCTPAEIKKTIRDGSAFKTVLDASGIPGIQFTTHDEDHWEMALGGNQIHAHGFKDGPLG